MASSKVYLEFVLEQLGELDEISHKSMMGEYIIYYRGRIIGGIYDDRFLVKPVKAAVKLMPEAELQLPYDGAKPMLLVEQVDDKQFLKALLEQMHQQLPVQKKK
ncbi:MAG: TfoX/Sxy family protein [Clostridia bacterium]|nr:TfoX/Sxy family protein [Clostridia bacterium]